MKNIYAIISTFIVIFVNAGLKLKFGEIQQGYLSAIEWMTAPIILVKM
jgi:hypothetical protein